MIKERLIRLIAEALRTSPLLELAINRNKGLKDIYDLGKKVRLDLLKLYLFQHSRNQDHWKSKINGWLFSIQDIKPKGGKFTSKDYLKQLWEPQLETPEEVISGIKVLYNTKYPDYNPSHYYNLDNKEDMNKLWEQLKDIYIQICNDLEKNNFKGINNYLNL